MIKLFAAIFMLLDHIGFFLCKGGTPQYAILRMVGRLSMPMFGYCIARGYYYSKKKGTLKKYFKNLIIFSIISQIPFGLISFTTTKKFTFENSFNIGFTWLFSLAILIILSKIKKPYKKEHIFLFLAAVLIFALSFFVKVDYGSYGVIFPIMFYFFMFEIYSPLLCFVFSLIMYVYYCIIDKVEVFSPRNQIVAIFSVFLIVLLKQNDDKIKLPKRFFYWFYPIHMGVLILIKIFIIEGVNSYNLFFFFFFKNIF